MATQLTTAAVQRLRPGKERREIRDGGCRGLILVVQPSGHKSWAMRFRRRGVLVRMTLGPVDVSGAVAAGTPIMGTPLTLASARRLAAEINHTRASGGDVLAAKHREKVERETKTFETSRTRLHRATRASARRARGGKRRASSAGGPQGRGFN